MRPDPKGRGTMCPCAVASKIMRLVENPPPAALHMLRRCVGFSWAQPSVTKSATHLLVFIVLFPTLAVLRAAPPHMQSLFLSILSILWFLKSTLAVLRAAPFLSILRVLWFLKSAGSPFWCIWCILRFLNPTYKTTKAFLRLKKAYFEKAY